MKRVAIYGAVLAAGAFALQWLDYQRMARTHAADFGVALVAAVFLALGVWLGARIVRGPVVAFDGNPAARSALGISPRELTVLEQLAAGRSNKEIAAALAVSPNTVKTHLAYLYEKLDATRRTEAIARARDLGIVR